MPDGGLVRMVGMGRWKHALTGMPVHLYIKKKKEVFIEREQR